jgi:hypothetical protein
MLHKRNISILSIVIFKGEDLPLTCHAGAEGE